MRETLKLFLCLMLCMGGAGQLWAADHEHDDIAFTATETLPTTEGNYYLTQNVEIKNAWTTPAGTVNLDLNGHTITQSLGNHVIIVNNNSTLNIYDCGTTVRYWQENDSVHYWKPSDDETELTTTGGCITGGTGFNANNTNPTGVATGTNFVGGGICNLGTLNIHAGNIVGNHVSHNDFAHGGGIYNEGALTIEARAKIIGNSINITQKDKSGFGGGVFNAKGATFVNNGEISYNYISGISTSGSMLGGGVCNYSEIGFTNHGTIAHNTCEAASGKQAQGGGVFTYTGTFTNTGSVTANCASLGGGILVRDRLVNSGEISYNIASDRGGGIQLWPAENVAAIVDLNAGSRLTANQCTGSTTYGKLNTPHGGYGGAICVNGGTLNIHSGTSITGNEAKNGGAGIYPYAGTTNVEGAVVVAGNRLANGTSSNVLLFDSQKLNIGDALEGADIGVGIRQSVSGSTVCTPTTGTVTSGYSQVGTALKHFRIDGIYTQRSIDVTAGEVAIGTAGITASATADNSGLLVGNSGQTIDITLSGRTYYKDGCWNTLCLPFSLTAEQLAASPLTGVTLKQLSASSLDGGTLTLTFTDATDIEAGRPYLAKWASGTDIASPTFSSVTISSETSPTVTTAADFVGLLSTQTANPSTDILLGSNNTLGFATTAGTMKAFGAYFLDKSGLSAAPRIVLHFDADADATAIRQHAASTPAAAGSRQWHTLQGAPLKGKPSRPGIYLHQGRKEVVR